MRVLLLPQDEISLDTLSTPPEIAAGANRVKKGIALEIGPLAIVGTGHAHGAYQHIWKTPLEYVSAHSSNPTAFVGQILTCLARSVKALEPGVEKHLFGGHSLPP